MPFAFEEIVSRPCGVWRCRIGLLLAFEEIVSRILWGVRCHIWKSSLTDDGAWLKGVKLTSLVFQWLERPMFPRKLPRFDPGQGTRSRILQLRPRAAKNKELILLVGDCRCRGGMSKMTTNLRMKVAELGVGDFIGEFLERESEKNISSIFKNVRVQLLKDPGLTFSEEMEMWKRSRLKV